MSTKKSLFANKTFLVALSFLLVMVLGAGIFGMEYSSAVSEREEKIESQNNQIKALESERNALASQNEKNQSKIADYQKEVNDLQSQIKELKKNDGDKVCYLTFDDGPSDNTLKILDILKRANAKASFFVIGTSKLDYIKRIHNEGHTVALHANNHDYSKIYKSEEAYFKDLNAIAAKVKKITGVDSKIIRFPGGSSNTISKDYNKGIMTRLTKQVQQKGYTYVDWNVDSTDASGNNVPKSKILNNVKMYSKGQGDICVLMHDTGAKNTTVEALPEMISYLRSEGFRFEALTTESPIFHHGVNN